MGESMVKKVILLIVVAIMQGLGILLYFMTENKVLTLGCTMIAFIIGLVFMNNTSEEERLEINDERNTMIRSKTHMATNNIIIFIQIGIAILLYLKGFYRVGNLITTIILLNGIFMSLSSRYYERKY
ncbi:hypothetical protein [uncultured Clostridium sp.]|uniref:hypothetical protein n=1 Tax=uncultured Clostridium sp. TaxID=59620 RepID=UPI002626BA13|nr:hypothetical protein [uncultured Clostridium sp.]